MDFDIYCDESRPDLLGSKNPHAKFMIIGGIWLKTKDREMFKGEINNLRDKYKIGGEFKWSKVSNSKIDFYKELVEWFFLKGDELRFRCIMVDQENINLNLYHNNDQEMGFYKFYYQLLKHWINDFNTYKIFLDNKKNRDKSRYQILKNCLQYSNMSAKIHSLCAVESRESLLTQLTDVLIGISASALNPMEQKSLAKKELVSHLNSLKKIEPSYQNESKFNIFKIKLAGGWE